jgi:hypothetical protein
MRLHKLVDCIDIKFYEEIPTQDVSNVQSTTKDIVEDEDEQVQESEKQESESDEHTNTQEDSNQQTSSNPPSRTTQNNHPAS